MLHPTYCTFFHGKDGRNFGSFDWIGNKDVAMDKLVEVLKNFN